LKKFDLIIFDADYTLFDFQKAEENAIRKLCIDLNIKYSKELLESYRTINHKYWANLEKGLIKANQINKARFKEFFEYININKDFIEYSNKYLIYLSQGNYLIKDAYNVIKKLYQNYDLVLLTNGLSLVQNPRFNNSTIKEYFKFMIISEEIGYQKPDKRIFDIIFKQLKIINLDRVLMVGDSLTSDIQGGINAKIATCWYNIDNRENNSDIRPNYVINKLTDVFNVLGE